MKAVGELGKTDVRLETISGRVKLSKRPAEYAAHFLLTAELAPKEWTVASAPATPAEREDLTARRRIVLVSHVARELSIDSLRDWIAQALHDPRQLHEGTSETVQAERVTPAGG